MICSPVLSQDCDENEVNHIFEARDDVLEFIMALEAG